MFFSEFFPNSPLILSAFISFSVSVPVLSEQITETHPTVSAATSFLMSAFDFASFKTLRERAMAAVVGSPSGTAATIKTIASMNAS